MARQRSRHPQRRSPNGTIWSRLEKAGQDAGLTWKFGLFAAYLMVVFALGGGSRGDIYSLVFLRPVAVLVLGAGLLTIRGEHVRRNRWLFAIAVEHVRSPISPRLGRIPPKARC